MNHFHKLFENQLREIYHTEVLLEQTLPEVLKTVKNTHLKEVLLNHYREIKDEINRLHKISNEWRSLTGHSLHGPQGGHEKTSLFPGITSEGYDHSEGRTADSKHTYSDRSFFTGGGSHALKGFIQDLKEMAHQGYQGEAHDVAVIALMQRVEHQEIVLYGTLKALARHLNYKEIAKLLHESSKEEGRADKRLTEIAEDMMREAASLKRRAS
ncbi:MAG: DUF892 family protein [Verrucomicrobia bacterium]|nr:DUF892 family protein [Verrucomicrobiota bacterium]